jgi:hypothetical protein
MLSLDDADVLAYMGSDWGEDNTETKYRYYADLSSEDLERYPGDEIIESLPDDVAEDL